MSFVGVPTRFLDFGAVKINSYPKPVPCTSNAIFCQPTEQTDDIEFQFIASESQELVTNGSFATPQYWNWVGWYWVFGNQHACNFDPVNALVQGNVLAYQGYYKVTMTVSGRTQGRVYACSSIGGVQVGTIGLNINSNGTFTGYFYNATASATSLLIIGLNDFDGCVDDISVKRVTYISDYTVQVLDHETSAVLDTVPVSFMRVAENVISVQFSWSDLSVTNGCRVLRVLDNTKVFEDTFDSDPLLPWTLGDDVTISGGDMTFLDSGASCLAPSGFDCGATIETLVIGESYEITYTVQNAASASVTVFAGLTQGTTRTANGTYTETLKCTFNTKLGFYYIGTIGQSIEIDNIAIIHADNIDGQSECYDLQDSHDCSLLFEWSNAESWGNYDYTTPAAGNAFTQKLRVISKFRGTKYPSTRLIGETSAGVKSMDYTSLRKKKILDIDFAPSYIHDALAAMFMQDNRTIGGISYILEDDYEPSAPSESRVLFKDMMTARIELEETDQPHQINRNI